MSKSVRQSKQTDGQGAILVGLFDSYNPIERIAANQHGPSVNSITRGSLISFHYPQSYAMIPNVIHDPYPMVIITDIWPKYIRGVNLHYLTFPYVKKLLTTFAGKSFSYLNIRNDRYMANAFRMYVRAGVKQPKRLDTEWLISILGSVRSFGPGELEQIRSNIQRQIQARLQTKANELTSYEQWRKGLTQSQQRQFTGKGLEAQNIIMGGQNRNLIKPAPQVMPNIGTNPEPNQ
mgnify:CR=1 FL=1